MWRGPFETNKECCTVPTVWHGSVNGMACCGTSAASVFVNGQTDSRFHCEVLEATQWKSFRKVESVTFIYNDKDPNNTSLVTKKVLSVK